MTEENVVKLNIDLLLPNPYQPRKQFNENSLKELALSIKEYGILNPILVRPKEDKYEIIAGERRTRAARLLKLTEIPAIIKNINDEKMAEIALIENLQRENITPIEEAITYQTILKNTNKTEKELSEMIGKSQPFIANKLRLLNLPEFVKNALINKKISERHARSLLTEKNEQKQQYLLEKVINEKLTVKELDQLIKENKITEAELNSVVGEENKSLEESDLKKEEKESDKMNNGNFFPNVNSTPDMNNNQASLNSMNMQAMTNNFTYQPEQPIAPMPEIAPVEPAQNIQPAPIPEMAPVMPMPEMSPTMPQVNNNIQPVLNPIENNEAQVLQNPVPATPEITPVMPAPEMAPAMPTAPEPPVIEEAAPITDIPLFNAATPEINQPIDQGSIVPPTVEIIPPVVPEMGQPPVVETTLQPELAPATPEAPVVPPMGEAPLFNPELAASVTPQPTPTPVEPENTFEVPIAQEQSGPGADKYSQLTEFLNNTGIEYKAYSNETNKCIIIEL